MSLDRSPHHRSQPAGESAPASPGEASATPVTDTLGVVVNWHGERTCVVTVTGELDVATAPDLNQTIQEVFTSAPERLVMDLDAVSFLDSTGLGVLVSAHQRMSACAGQFVVVCDNRIPLRVMEITALTRVFAFAPSVDEAVAFPDTSAGAPPGDGDTSIDASTH